MPANWLTLIRCLASFIVRLCAHGGRHALLRYSDFSERVVPDVERADP